MKDVWKEEENLEPKTINRKKVIVISSIITVIVLGIIVAGAYWTSRPVREWVDKNIFRKEVLQDKVATIELKEGQNSNIYAFNKYIGILEQAKFKM